MKLLEMLATDKEFRDRWIGVYIGILAVMLAICAMGGDNATKDATRANIEASDAWAFFQAKNIRRQSVRLSIDQLEIDLTDPALPAPKREAITKKVAEYKALVQRLTSEPETKEGIQELAARAKGLELERDIALRRDPFFDWAQALLQIAIVLASVYLIIGTLPLLAMSSGLAIIGAILLANAFFLIVG